MQLEFSPANLWPAASARRRLGSRVRFSLCLFLMALGAACGTGTARGASVGVGGYTNDFGTQPLAADWISYAIPGVQAEATTSAAIDLEVQAVSASTIITGGAQTVANATTPAADFNLLAPSRALGIGVVKIDLGALIKLDAQLCGGPGKGSRLAQYYFSLRLRLRRIEARRHGRSSGDGKFAASKRR